MQKYLLFLSLWHRTTARYEIIIIIIIIIIKINLRKKGLWSKSMFYFYTGKPLNKLQHLVSSSSSLGLGSRWEAVLWAQIAVIVRSQQQQPTFMIWNCRKTNKPKPLLSIVYMYSSQWDALKTGKGEWIVQDTCACVVQGCPRDTDAFLTYRCAAQMPAQARSPVFECCMWKHRMAPLGTWRSQPWNENMTRSTSAKELETSHPGSLTATSGVYFLFYGNPSVPKLKWE